MLIVQERAERLPVNHVASQFPYCRRIDVLILFKTIAVHTRTVRACCLVIYAWQVGRHTMFDVWHQTEG